MIDKDRFKYIDKEKYSFDPEMEPSKPKIVVKKTSTLIINKKSIPQEKLILIKRLKATKEKYSKINQLRHTKNYLIMDRTNESIDVVTDSIETPKPQNPKTPKPQNP